jgi:predicted nucleotidyltransferase
MSLVQKRGTKLKNASDIDLYIDIDPRGPFSLIDLVAMKNYLQDALHTKVDITTRGGLHPMLRHRIEQSAVRVF